MGLAFSGEHAVFASEGNSGRISLFDWSTARRRAIDLNQGGFDDSFTGDLASTPSVISSTPWTKPIFAWP